MSTHTIQTNPSPLSPAELDEAIRVALLVVDANMATFGLKFPDDTTVDNRYELRVAAPPQPAGGNRGWTTSFWTGQLWLAWELTAESSYRDLAHTLTGSFEERMQAACDIDTHDLGFLYTLSCCTDWRFTRDERARAAAFAAADHLMTRVLEPAGIIQAWGALDDPEEGGRTIIDSLMNTPLLYWVSEQSGDPRYAAAARRHTAALCSTIVRPDSTTFHTYHWDRVTGEPSHGTTHQGYTDDSCWSRGQAWGVYGFALNHRHTGEAAFLRAARRCADYFLSELPADMVAYWDLVFGDGSDHPRDSSAAAIAACGLLEIASLLPDDDDDRDRYREAAERIVGSLARSYTGASVGSNALLLHGVAHWPNSAGVDEGTLWGDYFYLEALTRLRNPTWTPYW